MKKDQKFNEVLSQCLDRIFRGQSIEDCLREYPVQAHELEPLLRTALAARKTSATIQPRAEFKARSRYELMTELHDRASQKKKSRFSFQWRWQSAWAVALTAMVVVVLTASGTALAASNSMPDDTLYPVKLATEQAQVALTTSDIGKAELHAKLADKRVEEIIFVAAKGDPQKVEAATNRLDDQLAKIATLTEKPRTQDVATGATPPSGAAPTRTPATGSNPAPSTPAVKPTQSPAPPVSARPSPRPTPGTVTNPSPSQTDAASRNINNSNKSEKNAEREKLKEVVTRNAVNHSSQLNNALSKAPPSVKPAIKKAISDAEAAYGRAIKNMNEEDQDDK